MENMKKKSIIIGAYNYIDTMHAGESQDEQFVHLVKMCNQYSEFYTEDMKGEMALSKEDAISLAQYVTEAKIYMEENREPSNSEVLDRAMPMLRKFYPNYFEKELSRLIETSEKMLEANRKKVIIQKICSLLTQHVTEAKISEELSQPIETNGRMLETSLKEITIQENCTLCGLCDQEELSDVFTYNENGKLTVRHGGVIDTAKHPKVLEVAEMCPEKAIQISEVKELSQEDTSKILDQFNRLVNNELRSYPFEVPSYYNYEYKSGTYKALPVPAKYQSDKKYLTDNMAENAGFSEFTKAVYSQIKNITKQFVVAYKVKKLQQFYAYEEISDNYYYQINLKISSLLEKAYQMAQTISQHQLSIPSSFCDFSVKPDLNAFSSELLQKLEDKEFCLSASGWLHVEEHYRTWVSTYDIGGKYGYDFTEAEQQLREDIDYALSDIMEQYVTEDITFLVNDYINKAKAELAERLTLLQTEVKRFTIVSSSEEFSRKITELCNMILQEKVPSITAPYMENFDTTYNDSARFSSLRACEKAAENRRERAYNAGYHFLERLPRNLEDSWKVEIAKTLTKWKRQFLSIYDLCGKSYPIQPMKIHVGKSELQITLNDHNEVSESQDKSVYEYVDTHIKGQACYGSINGESYASEFDCDIDTDYDCDFKETLFGDIKEVNKRYRYFLNLHIFEFSAHKISRAATEALESSDFMKNYFSDIKKSFISEIRRIAGI